MVAPFPFRSFAAAAILAAAAVALPAAPAAAQGLEIPQASPKARVEQQVGITNFTVDYASPGVKGRQIWGGLVPYGAVWRTGANQATNFIASRDFTFGGKAVPAGTYSLVTIPTETSWTVVLNSNAKTWGAYDYDAKLDVARVEVQPTKLAESRERLTFSFADSSNAGTRLDIEWEKLRISVPVGVDTTAQVAAGIAGMSNEAWRAHADSARWLFESDGDLKQALQLVETSIALKPTWSNHWVKAQIQAKAGKKSDAVKTAKQAQTLGKGDRIYEGFYVQPISAAVAGWQK